MSNAPIRNPQFANPQSANPLIRNSQSIQHNCIEVPTNKGMRTICLQQIIRIQGLSNYSRIYFNNGQYPLTVARVLKKFEEELPPGSFIRSHRTHLINREFVQEIDLKKSYISLLNGEMIAISRRKKNCLMAIAV